MTWSGNQTRVFLDVIFVVSLVASVYFGPLAAALLLLLTALHFVMRLVSQDSVGFGMASPLAQSHPKDVRLSGFMISQLFLSMALVTLLFPKPEDFEFYQSFYTTGFWLTSGFAILLIFVRLATMQELAALFRSTAPVVLSVCFAFLSFEKLSLLVSDGGCRIDGLHPLVFTPAVLFAGFSLLLFAFWPVASKRERAMYLVLLAMALAVAHGYTGSRFVAIVLAVNTASLAILFVMREKSWFWALAVVAAAIFGAAASYGLDSLVGCNLLSRAAETTTVINQDVSSISDGSVSLRRMMLGIGLSDSFDVFWTGSGIWSEAHSLFSHGLRQDHYHNQYLSWMKWGGIGALLSGFVFLGAIIPVLFHVKPSWKRDVICVAVLTHLPLNLMAFTWMRLEGFMLFHALMTILGLAILLEPTERKYPVLARLRQA